MCTFKINPFLCTIAISDYARLFLLCRRWRGFSTLNTKGTIKFTTCAVSHYFPSSRALHSLLRGITSVSSLVSRWEGLRPPVLPLQGGAGVRWWPQRPLPGVSHSFWRGVCQLRRACACNDADASLDYSNTMFALPLRDMLKYTASVREWMSADPTNVIAIHCKGGKGVAKDCVSSSFECTKILIGAQLFKNI